jgi:acetyl esterase/lipase
MFRIPESLALVVASVLAQVSRAEEAAPGKGYEVESHLNLVYRSDKDADPVKHRLDLYVPKGQKDFPVLLFVHGGSWKWGDKSLYTALGKTFAKQGIGTAVINYRLSDSKYKAKHPDHIRDVAAAFAWVHANMSKYGGRNDRIFVSGHSAGGHLTALLATDESYLKAHKLSLDNIRGALPLSGVYEIIANFPVYKEPFGTDAAACKLASPLHNVKAKHPPFLIGYGDLDFPTIDTMSEKLCAALKGAKCDACTLKVKNRDHFSIIIKLALDADDACTKAMLDFIAKHSEWKRP